MTVDQALLGAVVAKHSGAASVDVRLWVDDSALHVDVRDDGAGGARLDGSGLVGLSDRVEALGGRLAGRQPTGPGDPGRRHAAARRPP